jgi:hypothetical protein
MREVESEFFQETHLLDREIESSSSAGNSSTRGNFGTCIRMTQQCDQIAAFEFMAQALFMKTEKHSRIYSIGSYFEFSMNET